MKFWRSLFTIIGVVLFSSSMFCSQPVQALDLNTIVQTNPSVLAVENERRNVADDFFTTDFAEKIDINNSAIRDFRELRGFYPKLASIIIQNSPYEEVEDLLSIPDLSESQTKRIEDNLDKFTANPTSYVFTEGDERYNPGLY